MLKQSDKRNFVKWLTLVMALGHFSLTNGFLSGILGYPLPVLSGYTVRDLVGVAGFFAFMLLYKREV